MDCFLTYNLSCVNGTFVHFNSSSVVFGDVLDPSTLDSNNNLHNDLISSTNNPIQTSILVSVQHCIFTTIILGTIILATITGNIFVIAAVKLEKSLHSVAYYLFVSLAAADLMVASMVMPIAVLKEVTRSWVLGPIICDIWVMIDLLCCTASILHLVAIALDRYWAITNLDYGTKRTPGRVLILICVIWVTSILISSSHLFPIFRDKRGRPRDQCHLIGNVPYTILSTVGAFYIPLIVMCIIYWKIFQAAKFRIRRKAFNANRSVPPSSASTINTVTNTPAHNQHDIVSTSQSVAPNHQSSLKTNNKKQSFSPSQIKQRWRKRTDSCQYQSNDLELDNPPSYSSSASQNNNDYQLKSLKKTSYSLIKRKRDSILTSSTASPPAIQLSTTNPLKQDYEDESHQVNSTTTTPPPRRPVNSPLQNDSLIPIHTINNPLINSNSSVSNSSHATDMPSIKPISTTVLSHTTNNNIHNNTIVLTKAPGLVARKKIDIKRERKATKVLGVVMGCFILCWLPFFIEETICGIFHLTINEKIVSVLTWLGYMNSLLNPVIYTIFSPDFRQAFGKILFGKYRKRTRRLKK